MKTVLDTNVLIGFFRNPAARAAFEQRARRPLVLLSSVVILELEAGCRTRAHRRALEAFLAPFDKASRVLVPTATDWKVSGQVLSQLGSAGLDARGVRGLTNDVLIAVSSHRAGACVVTENAADFARIASHYPHRWSLP